jgi:hypothetical protein
MADADFKVVREAFAIGRQAGLAGLPKRHFIRSLEPAVRAAWLDGFMIGEIEAATDGLRDQASGSGESRPSQA